MLFNSLWGDHNRFVAILVSSGIQKSLGNCCIFAKNPNVMQDLLKKINAKRDKIRAFTSKHGPKNKLLLNVSIICGVVGTALAGIPAVGGSEAIETIKEIAKPGLPVWQLLCIGAAVMTMAATIATSMRSNHDTGNKLSKAQVCDAKLEMLELLLQNDQIDARQAIEKYGEYSTEVSFIE